MAADLGVVDAARPEAMHLVQLLRSLAEDWESAAADAPDGGVPDRTIVDAARWAMRTLNDVIADDAANNWSELEVPLLARLDGRGVFNAHPFVADDPALAETWESTFPILDADRDLRYLHSALNLSNLDRLTKQIPVPIGVREDDRLRARANIDEVMPYLASVAVEAVPSRSDDVYRGLARLEVEVCEKLIVRYELYEEVREREEVFAFIAVRQEQAGSVRRNIGTAHLELDPSTGQPHWYVFGPLLARFLNVPTQGDAFSLLLAGDRTSRREYLRSRLISLDGLEEARIRLDKPPEEEDLTDLIGDLPVPGPVPEAGTAVGDDPASDEQSNPAALPEHEAQGDGIPPETEEHAVPILPEIDHERVKMADAEVGTKDGDEAELRRPGGAGNGLGPPGPVDHERRQRLQRSIGRRGERVVYEAERRRVVKSGQDPDRVVWVAKGHPFSAYDIRSIDESGHTMYIEVKATTDDDAYAPFEISQAEVYWGLKHRSRYYIYRVTEAHTATPSIARFQDPIRMVAQGAARLGLSGARLAFMPPDSD